MAGYNPIDLGRKIEPLISRYSGDSVERRYYRFRGDRWYGGIASADVVGCNLRCKFCWSWNKGSFQTLTGFWISPRSATAKLRRIAMKRGFRRVRLTGGEPLLVPKHLEQLLGELRYSGLAFILETNGILAGYDETIADILASNEFVTSRVSIKGVSPEEFHMLTAASPEFFRLQIKAIENLVDAGAEPGRNVYPALMLSFSKPEGIRRLLEELKRIDDRLVESLDPEYVILYPQVRRLMKKYGLKPRIAYEPGRRPQFMI